MYFFLNKFLETVIWFNLSVMDSLNNPFGLSPSSIAQSQLGISSHSTSLMCQHMLWFSLQSHPRNMCHLTTLNPTTRRSHPSSQFQSMLEMVMPISPVHVQLPNSVHRKQSKNSLWPYTCEPAVFPWKTTVSSGCYSLRHPQQQKQWIKK